MKQTILAQAKQVRKEIGRNLVMPKEVFEFNRYLNQTLKNMCYSPYATFLHRQINLQIQKRIDKKQGSDPINNVNIKFIQHPLPLKDPEFKFLPLRFKYESMVLEKELDELSKWLNKGKSIKSFFRIRDKNLFNNQGLLMERILFLSKDFVNKILQMGINNNVPFDSIIKIYFIITADRRSHSFSEFPFFSESLIPESIPRNERSPLLIKISNEIHDLVVETFWVLIIIALMEFFNLLVFIKKNDNIKQIKKYLLEETCFLDDNLDEIKSLEQLTNYISKNYSFCILFYPYFREFLIKQVKKVVDKYICLVKSPVGFIEDDYKSYNKDMYKYGDFVNIGASKDKKRSFEFSKEERESFFNAIGARVAKKMVQGLLGTYKLRGDRRAVIRYFIKIIKNSCFSEIEPYYKKALKAKDLSSPRTLRRWKGKGLIKMDKDGCYSKHELTEVKYERIQNQRHQKPGYLNQTQLIDRLSSLDPLSKYPKSTLKRKINQLRKMKKTEFIKENNVVLFKEKDLDIEALIHAIKSI